MHLRSHARGNRFFGRPGAFILKLADSLLKIPNRRVVVLYMYIYYIYKIKPLLAREDHNNSKVNKQKDLFDDEIQLWNNNDGDIKKRNSRKALLGILSIYAVVEYINLNHSLRTRRINDGHYSSVSKFLNTYTKLLLADNAAIIVLRPRFLIFLFLFILYRRVYMRVYISLSFSFFVFAGASVIYELQHCIYIICKSRAKANIVRISSLGDQLIAKLTGKQMLTELASSFNNIITPSARATPGHRDV